LTRDARPALKQFKEFSFVTLHICGKTNKIWELMAEAGADCISIDNDASLLEAKQKIGQKVRFPTL